jgi:predicted transcriptional regulator
MIVSSHVGKTPSSTDEVSNLIRTVHKALNGLSSGVEPNVPEPAVPIRSSVTPDYIVCLEDGRKLKMLKRHLSTAYNMSPEEYRERWNLPADYPMVAPNYARQRSNLAKKIGLGTKRSRG